MKKGVSNSEVLERIDGGVSSIRRSVIINRTIYVLTFLIVLGLGYQIYSLSNKHTESKALIMQGITQNAEFKAKLDVMDTEYLTYIKTTVAAMLDKLQKDNPQLKVPKAPPPRPIGLPTPSDADLERPKSERPKPTPTPTPIVKIKTKKIYIKKPANWPFWKAWPPK